MRLRRQLPEAARRLQQRAEDGEARRLQQRAEDGEERRLPQRRQVDGEVDPRPRLLPAAVRRLQQQAEDVEEQRLLQRPQVDGEVDPRPRPPRAEGGEERRLPQRPRAVGEVDPPRQLQHHVVASDAPPGPLLRFGGRMSEVAIGFIGVVDQATRRN